MRREVESIFPDGGITYTGGTSTIDFGGGKTEKVEKVKGVNYDLASSFLSIKAAQELKGLFDSLTAQVSADHNAIAKLKADNDNLRIREGELKAANDNEAAAMKTFCNEDSKRTRPRIPSR